MRGRLHHVVEVDDVSTARADQAYVFANRPSQDHTTAFRSVERLCQHAERQGTHAWQQAMPELQEFQRNFPKDPQAWVALARARLATGAKRDAFRAVQEALSLKEDIDLGLSLNVLAAQGYSDTHKWPLVIKHAEAALALRPSDAETRILLLRALVSNKEGKSAKAQETVRLLMQADRLRGISLLREVAESSRSAADKHYWLSAALAGARAGGSPPQRQLLRDLAEASLVLDRREDALKLFEEAFYHPEGLADEDTAKSLAQMYLRNQRSKEAMEVYRVALQSFPGSAVLVRSYGQLLLKEKRTAEAIGAISRGAKLAPAVEASSLHQLLAELHQSLGQTGEALIAWEAAASLNPESPVAWRGLAAAARQDVPLQLRALRKLAQLEPGNAEWHAQLAAKKLATTHASGDAEATKEVEADLDRALRLCPSNALALEQKALMMERAGKDAQALDFIEVAAKENRTSKEVLEAAATARWKRGHFPEAVIWYQELEHLDSENCLWPTRLAQAALRQGQVAKAQAWLVSAGERLKRAEKALDQPKPPVVAEVRSWLGYGHLLQDNAKAALETLQKVPSGLGSASAFIFEALARRQQGEDTAAALRAAQKAEPRLAEVMYEMLPALPSRFMQHVEALLMQLKALPSEAGYPRTLDEYAKGRPVEVYSKSGGRWFPGEIVQAKDEMVKVRYLVESKDPNAERQWCEKLLLCSSDSLRPAPPKGEAPAMKVLEPAPSAAPAPKGIDVEAAIHRQTVQSVQRAPTPALGSKKEVEEEPRKVMLNPDDLQVGKVLGSGGFGAVYRGTYLGQEVAIKKLHLIDGQVTPEQKQEFKKEVENLSRLRHPRLVSLIGAALVAPSLMIVTEFMPNGSLYEALHQRKLALELEKRFKIATQVSEGVSFLHSKQPTPFVHRDLKSMNVVMDFELNAKLCDFGLTQSMEKTHISRRDNEGGSPRYMAPELFDSRGKITEKVDIWALGCLIVEVISSRLPHEECTSIQQVMTKTLVQKQLPFTDWRGVSLDIQRLAELCFVFPPDGRTNARHLLEGLNRLTRN
ncbi:unnamed protein product [Symbiodinium sp. CCMP2456]|nr:unnamed protein product [Symbiodinium sp. CCMP2456]